MKVLVDGKFPFKANDQLALSIWRHTLRGSLQSAGWAQVYIITFDFTSFHTAFMRFTVQLDVHVYTQTIPVRIRKDQWPVY